MKNSLKLVLASIASLTVASLTNAATLTYANSDTRTNGSFGTDTNSFDGDGSLRLTTTAATITGQDKVAVAFFNSATGYGTPLGTLGDVVSFTTQYFKNSSPSTTAASLYAFRLITNISNTQALVWENAYNGSATVPTDSWQALDMTNGKFWQRANGQNFNASGQEHPLSYYTAGSYETGGAQLSASTPIYGIEVAYGSGIGAFDGNIDNITLGFGGTTPVTYTDNITAPEPGSIALLGLAGVGLMMRRRR